MSTGTTNLTIMYFDPPPTVGALVVDRASLRLRVFTRDTTLARDIEQDLRNLRVNVGRVTITRVSAIEKDGWVYYPSIDESLAAAMSGPPEVKLRGIPIEALATSHNDVARHLLVSRFSREELDLLSQWVRDQVTLNVPSKHRISSAMLRSKDAGALLSFLDAMGPDVVREHFVLDVAERITSELKEAIERGEIAEREF